jgi:SecD/SecF fusion protein
MNLIKGITCFLLFFGALAGAVWPIVRDGQVNWLYDMDIEGGVQITYKADFSSVPVDSQTPDEKRRLLELSHLRLDSRLANFQGADVRIQTLGDDRLLVEVPGIRDIAKVRADLGKPKVVSFARVSQISLSSDADHKYSWNPDGKTAFWLSIDTPVIVGANVLYDKMAVTANARSTEERSGAYQLSLPLDADGQASLAALTTDAVDKPAQAVGMEGMSIPLMALLLDQELQDVFHVTSRGIRDGAISTPTQEGAELLKRLLSSGPMPVRFDVYSERSISPLVGNTLKQKALWALPISLALLFVLMGLAYLERPWFLFVYASTLIFWFLCLVSLANFHLIRISLLQLAGFALLLGMNSDSLVLVFEDLREDFRRERSFKLTLVGKAFKTEWWVIFWGMLTTVAVVIPLAFQKGIFTDFIMLLLFGMAINILGFILARLLMSLDFSAELSLVKIHATGLATLFSRLDFVRFRYAPIGVVLMALAIVALFRPGIPLSPTFAGGRAIEIAFPSPVAATTVQSELARYFGTGADIRCEESAGTTRWAQAKFPTETQLDEQALLGGLASATSTQPQVISVQEISRSLAGRTWWQVSLNMSLGLAALLVLAFFIYNGKAGFYVAFALAHDFLLCLLAMVVFRVSLDLTTTAALATMVGYSIYDSVVVLHKLRALKLEKEAALGRQLSPFRQEDMNMLKALPRENIRRIPARVVLTSSTAALPLGLMALLAGGVFRDYAVITFAGAIFGTLSSIYFVGRVVPSDFIRWGDSQK